MDHGTISHNPIQPVRRNDHHQRLISSIWLSYLPSHQRGATEELTVSGGHGTRQALAHYPNLQAHITSPPSHCVPCLIMRVAVRRLFFLLNINTSCLLNTTMEQSTLSQLFKKEPKGLKESLTKDIL